MAQTVPIYDATIFVGVGWDPCDQGGIWRNYVRAGQGLNSTPWYLERATQPGVYILNEDLGDEMMGTLAIKVFGSQYYYSDEDIVEAGWTCAPEKYKDEVCDCGCGIMDRACLKYPEQRVGANGCAADEVCYESRCVKPRWDTAQCALASYGDGKSCECGCGLDEASLPDPDCYDIGMDPVCNNRGTCNRTTWQCELAWQCTAEEYSDDKCTCKNCGVVDPM